MNLRVPLCLCVLLASCNPAGTLDAANGTSPILFGEQVRVGDFPSIGFLPTFEDGRSAGPLCTASLISPDTVLTAAHCLEDAQPTHEIYFARELTAFPILSFRNDRWSRVQSWVLHPDYVSASEGHIAHDLALLFLDAPVLGVQIPAVADARIAPHLRPGADVHIVGYGQDQNNHSGPLRSAKTVISFVGDEVIRTGGTAPTPSRCSGDSGGPTFMDVADGLEPPRRIVSVNSYGFQTCDSASTEARVDAYLDWIVGTMLAACDEGSRSDTCQDDPSPRMAEPSVRPDAGVSDPPSLGPTPDAGSVEVPVRPPQPGCRCAHPGPDRLPLVGLLLLMPLIRRRGRG